MKTRVFFFLSLILCSEMGHTQSLENRLKHLVDSFYQALPNTTGILIHVEAPDRKLAWSYAAGYADKTTRQKLTADQPVLIASNTKTYVAAAILKLAENRKFRIDDPIGPLISERSKKRLQGDGYDLNAIHIKHLLSHTSGISDYTGGNYLDFVNENRRHHWTRDEQIKRTVDSTAPLAAPGDSFKYADVNYLLLTEIIEKATDQPFYTALRKLLSYKKFHLDETWFVTLERKPSEAKALAHQYWSKYSWDSYDLDPSWDLYGGGGIAATTDDLALFFQRLFEGDIIHDKHLLELMHTEVLNNYCLGVRKQTVADLPGYSHGGFWGTYAIYFPPLNSSIAIFILQKDEKDKEGALCKEVVTLLKQ